MFKIYFCACILVVSVLGSLIQDELAQERTFFSFFPDKFTSQVQPLFSRISLAKMELENARQLKIPNGESVYNSTVIQLDRLMTNNCTIQSKNTEINNMIMTAKISLRTCIENKSLEIPHIRHEASWNRAGWFQKGYSPVLDNKKFEGHRIMAHSNHCLEHQHGNFTTIFGTADVPEWEALITIGTLSLIIILTIIGNVLVILGVFTHKPLRIVQNFFIVSLAVADLTVAILVLPLNVINNVLGRWIFGIHTCKMWLTSDVLCCTASILNLCAIALDRYWAITDPINYAQKRTVKRVLLMIAGVWILSLLISSPPLIGWNDWPDPETFLKLQECKLTERQGYVIYSSLGSFYIPLFIMTLVYIEIFIATKRRLRERAKASKINAISKSTAPAHKQKDKDRDSVSSETNHNEHPDNNDIEKERKKEHNKNKDDVHLKPILMHEDSVTDNAENSSGSQKNCPTTSEHKHVVSSTTTITFANSKSPSPKVIITEQKKSVVYSFIEEKQKISLSKERRAARTLGIIMGVFVVCWLPFFLMYVIIPFCPTCCVSNRLRNFITWLGYINSVLNPIIYTIFNMDFRRAFRKLLGLQG